MFDTPVLFIVFNRPKYTKQVFAQIRKSKPKQLFIAADGPRLSHPNDIKLCNETRQIIKSIDWECDLKTMGVINVFNSIIDRTFPIDKKYLAEIYS